MSLYESIGQSRREIAALVDQREELIAKLDEMESALEALQAAEDAEETAIEASAKEIKAGYDSVRKLNDSVRKQEFALKELEDRYAVRKEAEASKEVAIARPEFAPQKIAVPMETESEVASVKVLPPSAEQLDKDIADFVRCSAMANGNHFMMPQVAQHLKNDRLYAAMTEAANPSILPDNYVPRLIELLYPMSVMRRLPGVRMPRLNNGNLRLPRMLSGSTASYVGEQECFPLSTPTTGPLTLTAKKLVAAVVSSGELVRRSDPSANRMILDDLVMAIATREDITFIRSLGGPNVPTGLLGLAAAGNQFAANAANTVDSITQDLGQAILNLEAADLPMRNPAWIMHPRSARCIMDLRDGNGNMAFPEMARGMLREYPVYKTSQIPVNLGGGANESEVYFVDASELILADSGYYSLESSAVAAYNAGGGPADVRATFTCDEVVHRVITEHDFNVRYDQAISVITSVTWGA